MTKGQQRAVAASKDRRSLHAKEHYAKQKASRELRAAQERADARRLETVRAEQARLRREFYERRGTQVPS